MEEITVEVEPITEVNVEMLGQQGIAGPPGKSAYQSAVDTTGFAGTETEWVASLNPNLDPTLPDFVQHWLVHG